MTRAARALAALGLATAAPSCGPKRAPDREVLVPARSATAGDAVLQYVPSGADALLEIDLRRLRENSTVGPLVRALTRADVPADLVGVADLLVFASYGVGGAEPSQLILATGRDVSGLRGAQRVASGVVAFGSPSLLARLAAVQQGGAPAATADRALLRARAMAMPARARGAAIRMAAALGFEARLALARRLDLDAVPTWLSVWIDVADDLAAIALLGGDADAQPDDLARAVERLRGRLVKTALVERLGLGVLADDVRIGVREGQARVVIVIGPRCLASLVQRVLVKAAGDGDGDGDETRARGAGAQEDG